MPVSADPADSDYATIALKVKKASKKSITLQWKKVSNADGYIIYANKSGSKNKYKQIKVIKGRKTGKCTIYVYAQNGLSAKVKVTVKK